MSKRVFLTSNAHEAANHLAEEGIPVLGWDAIDILDLIPEKKRILLKLDFEGGEDGAIYDFNYLTTKPFTLLGNGTTTQSRCVRR